MATNTTVTQTALPAWLEQYYQNVLGRAQGATSQPYQTYDAPRIAGFAPEQEQAFNMVKSNVGNYKPALDAAMTAAGRGTTAWTDPGVASSYMNPYEDEVVDDVATLGARNLVEKLLPNVNRTFVGGGTFGGSRSADFTARAVRDTQESVLREQNRLRQEGYTQGAQIQGADASRALTGATTFGGIGSTQSQLAGRDAAALEAVGDQRQQLAQTSADTAYADFERQRDYDITQLQTLTGIGGSHSASGSGSSSVTTPRQNNTAATLGAVATGIGTIGKLFGDNAEGGRVRYAKGDRVRRPRIMGIGDMR